MKQIPMYEQAYLDLASARDESVEAAVSSNLHQACFKRTDQHELQHSISDPQHHEPKANVTEIIIAKGKADSVQMVLPMLTHLSQENRWLAWIDPPIQLLKQWKSKSKELNIGDIMVVRSTPHQTALELTKKALTAGTCHAVIVWTEQLGEDEFQKLEQASAAGNSHGIVLRYR